MNNEPEPNDAEAYYKKGEFYYSKEKYEEAINEYNKAIELKPDFPNAYKNRGNSYYYLKKYEEAIADYRKAIEIKPDFPNAYYNRGLVYYNQQKYKEAIRDYSKAIEIKPDFPNAYNSRGIVYYYQQKYEEAISDYSKAIEIKPNYAKAYFNRGISFSNMGKSAKSDVDIIKYFVLEKKDPIETLGYCNTMNQVEKIASALMKENTDCRFNSIIASNNSPKLKSSYKNIYIHILKIIYILLIKNSENFSVAHYTTRETALQLIFKDSPFRLSSVLTTNDPTEGDILLKYLNVDNLNINSSNNKNASKEKYDFQAFINCFSFNKESLNQFRLYGKEDSKEATGVSIVLKGNYFSPNMCLSILPSISKANIEGQKDNDEKDNNETDRYPIFRCLYIDPEKKEVVSIGSRDNNTANDLKVIQELLNAIKEEIENVGKENFDKDIIDNLFLTLRYLVKHSAFKEEQECRMICIKDMVKDAKKEKEKQEIHFNPDCSRMYINYQKIDNTCLDKVIFGPKAEGFEIFKEALMHEQIDCECKKSELPFA
jgi:Tfp pilus assembly protein PilF